MAATNIDTVNSSRNAEFDRAFELLQDLVDWSDLDQQHPVRENAVYTTSVVLWMLVYQRIHSDSSLEAAVKMLVDSDPGFLPQNKRITEDKLSLATGGYSRARKRLPREAAERLAERVSHSLIEGTQASFEGRRVFLIDGTTLALAPEAALRKEFPPASNQHGLAVWPEALLVVAHELSSGVALRPAIGAMYGERAVSETALVKDVLVQMPADGIAMADAGFGIFAVAWDVAQFQRDFVLRMTEQRFAALRRQATLIEQDSRSKTYSLIWRPSSKERRTHPNLPADAALEVRLHEVQVHDSLTLHLVTSLPQAATLLSDLYLLRGDIEIDLRNLKVVLDTENIRARTVEMFHKELLTSMVAYNLVNQFRQQAAQLINEPPRRMSFKRVWTTFRTFLWSKMFTDPTAWRNQYRKALGYAMKDKLPKRPGRSFDREAYHRRHKSTSFKKRIPKKPLPEQQS